MGLERYLKAHELDYEKALTEIKNGHKETHWIWYIFPQLKYLGSSEMSIYYSFDSLEEAKEYLNNDILRNHLMEILDALLKLPNDNIAEILGIRDNLKLHSCLTLFLYLEPDNILLKKVLDKYYHGIPDQNTLNLIKVLKKEK